VFLCFVLLCYWSIGTKFLYFAPYSLTTNLVQLSKFENASIVKQLPLFQDVGLSCNVDLNDRSLSQPFIFVMFGTRAFLPLILNWLCNTLLFSGIHNRTVIIVDDYFSSNALSSYNVGLCMTSKLHLNHTGFHYNTFGYWQLVQQRVRIIEYLTALKIPILLFEPDALWVRNPLEDDELMNAEEDLVGFNDDGNFGFGWLRLTTSESVHALMQAVRIQFDKQLQNVVNLDYNHPLSMAGEQHVMVNLLKNRKKEAGFSNITTRMLTECKYLSGKWYDGGRGGNGESVRKKCNGFPVVINNNWIVGNEAKIARAKRWGHWFLPDDLNGTCGSTRFLEGAMYRMRHSIKTAKPFNGPPRQDECPLC